jgi:hypothetical protein
MRRALLIIPVALAGLISACGESTATSGGATTTPTSQPAASQEVNPGGDIPDTQTYVSYAFPTGAFTVKVPEGWARSVAGSTVSFTSHFDTISLSTTPLSSQPTPASVSATEVPAIQQQPNHTSMGQVFALTRPGGQAILITYKADSPPDPVTGNITRVAVERYDFWHAGVEAIVTLAAPVGADNVDPWRVVTESFLWH